MSMILARMSEEEALNCVIASRYQVQAPRLAFPQHRDRRATFTAITDQLGGLPMPVVELGHNGTSRASAHRRVRNLSETNTAAGTAPDNEIYDNWFSPGGASQ